MKLRVFEIDAIASKVIETIKNSLTIPDYSKEVNERAKLYHEFMTLIEKEQLATTERKEFGEKHNFSYYSYTSHFDFTPEKYLDQLQNEYLFSKLPQRKDIENAVILSGNKDLNDLVQELIKKYTN